MTETLYRLKDIEKDAGVENRCLFQIRKNWQGRKTIGIIQDRAICVTKAEADWLLARLGKTGQSGHDHSAKEKTKAG